MVSDAVAGCVVLLEEMCKMLRFLRVRIFSEELPESRLFRGASILIVLKKSDIFTPVTSLQFGDLALGDFNPTFKLRFFVHILIFLLLMLHRQGNTALGFLKQLFNVVFGCTF